MTGNLRGALFALLAFAVFSTHDVVIKVLGGSYSPIQIVFFSVLLSFPLATIMLMRDSTSGTLIPRHPWWVAVRTASALVTAVCIFYAFTALPLAQVYAILFASPLLITLLAIPVLGETVGPRRAIAVVVGLLGVIVVLRPAQTDLSLGHAAALVGAIGSSVTSIIIRKIGSQERPVVMLLYPMMANFLVMGAALPLVYEPMPLADLGLMTVVAVLAWSASRLVISAYQNGEAVIIAPMQYSQIIWATAFGLLFFDETIDLMTGIGAAIIISSGIYIVARESGGSSTNTPVLRTRSRWTSASSPRISVFMRARGTTPPRDQVSRDQAPR